MLWSCLISLAAAIHRHWWASVGALVLTGFLVLPKRPGLRDIPSVLIPWLLFSGYGLYLSSLLAEELNLRRDLERSDPKALSGWVGSYPEQRGGRMRFTLVVAAGRREVEISASSPLHTIGYGDSLLLRGSFIRGGRGRRIFCARRGGVEKKRGKRGALWRREFFWPLHQAMRVRIQRAMGCRSGLPLALLLGERAGVSVSTREAMRRLGISHLLALSGLHLALLVGALSLLIRPAGAWRGIFFTLILALYVLTARDLYSLWRAYAMLFLASMARAVGRRVDPGQLLAGAGLLVLMARPGSLYEPSFRLSFAATWGVILSCRRPSSGKGPGRALLSSLQVGLGAQVFVLPLVLRYFGAISPFSPPATLLFLLPTAAIIVLAFLLLPFSWPGGWSLLFNFVGFFEKAVILLSCHLPPPLSLPAPNPWFYYAGLFFAFRSSSAARILAVAVLTFSFLL